MNKILYNKYDLHKPWHSIRNSYGLYRTDGKCLTDYNLNLDFPEFGDMHNKVIEMIWDGASKDLQISCNGQTYTHTHERMPSAFAELNLLCC